MVASVVSLRASFAQTASEPQDTVDADGGAPPLEPFEPFEPAVGDAGASPPAQPPVAPAPAAPAPAAAPPAAAKDRKDEEKERSPLVPDVDVRQHAKKVIAPNLTFRQGKGVTLSSTDGQFELTLKIRAQILATLETDHSPDGETELGAQIRRARLALDGHFFGKHNKYKFELANSARDAFTRGESVGAENVGTAPLLDWYLTFDYLKEATLVTGQYKVPFNRQRVISSGSLQLVDRSIVQGEFNLDRNVGFDLRSKSLLGGHLHYYGGAYAGEGRNAFELRNNNVVYLARVEVLPFGNFEDYVEADFERTGPRVSIGGAYAHVTNSLRDQTSLGDAPADGGTTTFDTTVGDVLLKMYGFSFATEIFWREGDRKLGDAVDESGVPIQMARPRDGYGGFGQFGFLLPHTMFEIEGRYGMLRPTSADKSSLTKREELGGGVTYYFARHSFKLQANYFRLWANDRISDGTDQVRLQLEAGF